MPIDPNIVSELLGSSVAVSPLVTIEPLERKFHKKVTLTIPRPKAAGRGLTQYSAQDPNIRVLCKISGKYVLAITVA